MYVGRYLCIHVGIYVCMHVCILSIDISDTGPATPPSICPDPQTLNFRSQLDHDVTIIDEDGGTISVARDALKFSPVGKWRVPDSFSNPFSIRVKVLSSECEDWVIVHFTFTLEGVKLFNMRLGATEPYENVSRSDFAFIINTRKVGCLRLFHLKYGHLTEEVRLFGHA